MASTAVSCVKYLLFVFNLLFALSGVVILVVGIISQAVYYDYHSLIGDKLVTLPNFGTALGLIIFFVAFFGCCGAIRANRCLIFTFVVLLILLLVLEISVGISAYVFRDDVLDILNTEVRSSMSSYHNNSEVRHAWDIVQQDFKCCGVTGPGDWKNDVPSSCCSLSIQGEACPLADAFPVGCLEFIMNELEHNVWTVVFVFMGVAFVQILGVLFACCLARSINKDYETV